jgi:hypothetical protein
MKRLLIMISAMAMILLFAGEVMALDITFQWDANTETDLAGYKVYYKISYIGGPPYNGTVVTEGNSPIDVGNVTQVTLHGFPDGDELKASVDEEGNMYRIWAVVTAYNILRLESGFSNEVDAGVPKDPKNMVIPIPSP